MLLALATTLLVLDLAQTGADEATARAATEEVLAAAIVARPGAVSSAAAARDLLGVEARRQMLGCDDSACAAQIAGALGARQVLSGSLLVLERQYLVQLRLIDTQDARVLGRTTAQSRRADDLPDAVRRATFELLGAPYVPLVRHRARRGNEAGLLLGFHSGPGPGGVAAAHFAWRIGDFAVGPVAGHVRAAATVGERDLPGFSDRPRDVRPAAWTGGVRGAWRRSLTSQFAARVVVAGGLALLQETEGGGASVGGGWLRPGLALEFPAEADLFFSLELGWMLVAGSPSVQLRHLDPFGGAVVEARALPLSGPQASLGVDFAF